MHLLHYIPERRTMGSDYIEDVIPLYNAKLRVQAAAPQRVSLAPEGTELPFSVSGGSVEVVVPQVRGHQMVVLDE